MLARNAAASLVAAACKDRWRLWNAQEEEHSNASTQKEAQQAADPLLAVCAECPITAQCHAWAQVDQYTGIAAGTAWLNGKPRPPHWIRRPFSRSLAS